MQEDIALAQAATLREWADLWERDAIAGARPDAHEASVLMLRCARVMDCIVAGRPIEEAGDEALPPPQRQDELRDG